MRITPSCFIAAAVLALDAHGATPNMREGEWEMKVKIEMPSVPMAVPPQVMQRCITKKDLADAERNLSGPLPGDSRCKITDHKMQGNTATWKLACADGATGRATVTYNDTTYAGTITMSQSNHTPAMNMHHSGRHLGPCRKP